jgi:hypothetical protein
MDVTFVAHSDLCSSYFLWLLTITSSSLTYLSIASPLPTHLFTVIALLSLHTLHITKTDWAPGDWASILTGIHAPSLESVLFGGNLDGPQLIKFLMHHLTLQELTFHGSLLMDTNHLDPTLDNTIIYRFTINLFSLPNLFSLKCCESAADYLFRRIHHFPSLFHLTILLDRPNPPVGMNPMVWSTLRPQIASCAALTELCLCLGAWGPKGFLDGSHGGLSTLTALTLRASTSRALVLRRTYTTQYYRLPPNVDTIHLFSGVDFSYMPFQVCVGFFKTDFLVSLSLISLFSLSLHCFTVPCMPVDEAL